MSGNITDSECFVLIGNVVSFDGMSVLQELSSERVYNAVNH